MNIVNDYEYFILKKLQETIDRAYDKVVELECSEEAWEALYHFVFSDRVSNKIYEILPNFEWYDPDATYREDVCAFIDAFWREMDELIIV
jgi:hypothetical protein